ncbi:MAG TPA: ferrous iron transporter B [Thermoanaerobaculia bacterium]|nr:ferrous iron transporter B [Thermoanaerobaculia bacterium]
MSPAPAATSPLAEPPAATAPSRDPLRIALVGNPNTGKTTLFNRLCGLRAKTANFPGTTTDARIGRMSLPTGRDVEVVDLPGIYRLTLDLPESRVCRGVLGGEGFYRRPDAVVAVLDATNLARNLHLLGEVLAKGLPTVVALNMVDLARRRGLTFDAEKLSRELGCPVVPIMARKGEGTEQLLGQLAQVAAATAGPRPLTALPGLGTEAGLERWADGVVERSLGGTHAVGAGADTLTERLDQAFTHPILGVLLFTLVMAGLFWTLFALAKVPMDLIEATFSVLGGWVAAVMPAGALRDLVANGILGGIAGTVVFLPQICLLFLLISLLEDTGYLARAAFVMDRILCRFGLPGHAFVPLLSSHACAIPGILATRLIPDRQDRLTTILVAPFMSCSARLPVYVLLTGLLFEDRPLLGGLVFAGCYLLGGAAALLSALVARRSFLAGRSRPMVLELPSYKVPSLRTAAFVAWDQGLEFLKKAGTTIMAICVVMWWLSAYPVTPPPPQALALEQRAATLAAADPAEAERLRGEAALLAARTAQAGSYAGRLGRLVQPVFEPLGYDWQLTVGVLTSFVAREVFVSTMSVLLVGSDDLDPEDRGVLDRLHGATRDDGTLLFSTAASASLLVFFVLAMQCLPTLAVTRRETGSVKWAALQLGYMSALAYVFAFITYRLVLALGGS